MTEKTKIEIGTLIYSDNGGKFEVIEVSKKGTPTVKQISDTINQIKNLHWSPNNNCWQLFGKPIKLV
jgi:hypothetical protein